jgi:hypothetical protein
MMELMSRLVKTEKTTPPRREEPAMDREDEETTRRRVLLELEAKEAFEYRKRLTADRLKAVPIYNRERDPATLTDFLLKLSDAWKHCFPIDGEAAKLVFLRQRCSPSMGEWMNSLVPTPTSAQEWLEAIQKEHGAEDEEAAARAALAGLRLVGPYTETSLGLAFSSPVVFDI